MRYTINAMRELEGRLGIGVASIFDVETLSFDKIVHLVWVGLRHGGDRKLTVDEAGDLIQEHWLDKGLELRELMDAVIDAMKLAGIVPKDRADKLAEGDSALNPQ